MVTAAYTSVPTIRIWKKKRGTCKVGCRGSVGSYHTNPLI